MEERARRTTDLEAASRPSQPTLHQRVHYQSLEKKRTAYSIIQFTWELS